MINTLQYKNNPTEKQGIRGIINRMVRECQKYWLLKNLRDADIGGHIENHDTEALKMGASLSVDRGAYLDTLSNLPKNKRLSKGKLNRKIETYKSIIDSCIHEGLIIQLDKQNTIPTGITIRVSHLGDDYISKFIYKTFFDNPIATALIIGAIGWIFTSFVLKPAITEVKLITPPNINLPKIVTPINIYSTSTTPNIYPVINVYPNATTTPKR